LSHPSRKGTTSSTEALLVVEGEAAFETFLNLEEKNVNMDPEGSEGPENKNYSTDESQQ
jgi:hypothetical protein